MEDMVSLHKNITLILSASRGTYKKNLQSVLRNFNNNFIQAVPKFLTIF